MGEIKECFTCYCWEVLNSKPICEKGFCYKNTTLPEPRLRNDYCQDWSKEDEERSLFERV